LRGLRGKGKEMITAEVNRIVDAETNKADISFKGLSGDTKPVTSWEQYLIGNGSSFMEIDTKKLKFYNETANEWV